MRSEKLKIAYLAHGFPLFAEHYFRDDIEALRQNDFDVLSYACIKMKSHTLPDEWKEYANEIVYLSDVRFSTLIKTVWLFFKSFHKLGDIYRRLISGGEEGTIRRLKGFLHILMGIYFAIDIEDKQVKHIHAHHGYLASWVAMIASRLLGISYSMTLHGSDLLIDRVFMDLKVRNCSICFTISEYNKKFLLQHYPFTPPDKVVVRYLGVDQGALCQSEKRIRLANDIFRILTVGRLETVKNHEFLIKACSELKRKGFNFRCDIVGDGSQQGRLLVLIKHFGLDNEVKLIGFVDRKEMPRFYRQADLFVLTSKSEGLPIVLMESMSNNTIVLAPNISGIPEIVEDGKTGFLYHRCDLTDFISKILYIRENFHLLDKITADARRFVMQNFNKKKNLDRYAELLRQHLIDQVS